MHGVDTRYEVLDQTGINMGILDTDVENAEKRKRNYERSKVDLYKLPACRYQMKINGDKIPEPHDFRTEEYPAKLEKYKFKTLICNRCNYKVFL